MKKINNVLKPADDEEGNLAEIFGEYRLSEEGLLAIQGELPKGIDYTNFIMLLLLFFRKEEIHQ